MYSLDFKFQLVRIAKNVLSVSQNTGDTELVQGRYMLMRHDTIWSMLHTFIGCCFHAYVPNQLNGPHKHVIYHSMQHAHTISSCHSFVCGYLFVQLSYVWSYSNTIEIAIQNIGKDDILK